MRKENYESWRSTDMKSKPRGISRFNIFVLISLFILISGCVTNDASARAKDRIMTVPDVDLTRYTGRWYEIARLQNTFERNLVGVTAEYSLREDGRIKVVNSGFRNTLDGKLSRIQGVAWIPNTDEPGYLKVRFFWPFAGDYKIFGLDTESYEWAVVGDDSRRFLWLLARNHEISDALFADMKRVATDQGFDTTQLFLVPQKARE